MTATRWLNETLNVYISNATAVRDFRVQLRGNRSVLLFGTYLLVLIVSALLVYSESVRFGVLSVVDAQRRLGDFYQTILLLLGGAISLITPALSATAIVAERQRQSLDLVFSAPVSPRYYLVGKMISSYRYTWMLLILSLPVTAACVVLGGASWSDVLGAYVLLSFHGLILTSLALLVSSFATKPVSAIIWGYAAAAGYLIPATALAASTYSFSALDIGRVANEAPFYSALSPFFVFNVSDTVTRIAGFDVPNWILAAGVALLISKLCLLGAGSILRPWGGKETAGLRIHGLVYAAAIALYAGSATASSLVPSDYGFAYGVMLCWGLMPLILVLPTLTCYGFDAERRLVPNGVFKLSAIFDGTPAGALPYILALLTAVSAALLAGAYLGSGRLLGLEVAPYIAFSFGLTGFFWAVGRYASSALIGVRAARIVQFASFLVLCVLPVPFLMAVAAAEFDRPGMTVWDLYLLRPIVGTELQFRSGNALVIGLLMAFVALLVSAAAEANLKRRLAERPATAT